MKRMVRVIICLGMLLPVLPLGAEEKPEKPEGWKLAVQAWTFRQATFLETLEKLGKIDVKYVEAYPGQRLGGDLEGVLNHNMNEETRKALKKHLEEAGIRLVCYGVVQGGNEEEWRRIFGFAKEMGVETINSEPNPAHLELLDKLTEEYGVQLAIHNHPGPRRYADPAEILTLLEGRSKRMGVCGDSGHWMRTGFDPVEKLKQVEGRLLSMHFKDLNAQGERGARDVPWGTGKGQAGAQLQELYRQGFKGVISIEYEHITSELLENVGKCVEFYRNWRPAAE